MVHGKRGSLQKWVGQGMLALLLICWTAFSLQAQDFNEPDEVLHLMEKSSVRYKVVMSDAVVAEPVAIGLENDPMTYASAEDGVFAIATYQFDEVTAAMYKTGDEEYGKGNFAEARGNYIKINELRPDISVMLTLIGRTYEAEGNPAEAIKWYQQGIAASFHDPLAHYRLAENLFALKQFSSAAEEICVAWILNRNSTAIAASAAKIFKADRRHFTAFDFVPNYRLVKTGGAVEIHFSEDWMLYAFCKALWSYEPGYHRELGGGRGDFDMVQEKECLLNLAMGYDRIHQGKAGKNVEINTLIAAIQAKMINEFIFMEEWLRIEPLIAYTQPKEAVMSIASYILEIRAPKK